jgi:GNAT superfamily N-acetyltransferase
MGPCAKKTVMPTKKTQLPPGYKLVPVRTTYLEMRNRPETEPVAPPPGCAVERWEGPEVREYLELFSAVGGEWGWSGRLFLKEEELRTMLHARTTEIYLLRCGGQVAGFGELDRSQAGSEGPRRGGQAEVAYFGLLPGFIGRGLGKFLLDWVVRRAWEGKTERIWLHTCAYDHPGALAAYLKAGFRAYDEKIEWQPYPEVFLQKTKPAGG